MIRSADLSVVIPSRAWSEHLSLCLESLLHQSVHLEVLVVDNSDGGLLKEPIRNHSSSLTWYPRYANDFFSIGVNAGIRQTTAPWVAVINDDTRVEPNWAENVLAAAEQGPDVGSVASLVRQWRRPELVDSMGDHLNLNGLASGLGWNERLRDQDLSTRRVFAPSASCAVYRRTALESVDLFDEDFTAYYEDVDLGFRLQLAGYFCILEPNAVAWHIGGATHKARERALFWTERNMVWTLWKNLSFGLYQKYLPSILRTISRPAPVVGGSTRTAWSRGKAAALLGYRNICEKREFVQATRCVSDRYIDALASTHKVTVCHL